jgi:signal transduction histidine kinase
MQSGRAIKLWLYLLGAYVLLQFGWWAWLLSRQFEQLKALESALVPTDAPLYEDRFRQKLIMIFGEGAVFLLLLALGFYFLLKAIRRRVDFMRRQRNFLLSVTHELNSPLSAIRLNLETQISRDLPTEARTRLNADALQETRRLQDLIENLLTSARLEEKQLHMEMRRQNLSAHLSDICSRIAKGRTDRLEMEIQPDIQSVYDTIALDVILKNLIENAFKYSPNKVIVSLDMHENIPRISVRDLGNGISTDELDKIFDRFYRAGNEQTRTTRGTGLGLYISRKLAQAQGMRLSAENHPQGGAVFTLIFKL